MENKKEWYTSGVNYLLNQLDGKCSNLYLSRVLFIYLEVKKLMDLCDDTKNCKSQETKNLIKKEMSLIIDELHHYQIYDDRFDNRFDEGK